MSELNNLELEFLRLNNYSLFVTIEELQKYGDNILYHWNQTQDLESLVVKDITNNNNTNTEEIARPFSQLTMKTQQQKSTTTTSPVVTTDTMDKHSWRYNSNSGNSNRPTNLLSGNNTSTATETVTTTTVASAGV